MSGSGSGSESESGSGCQGQDQGQRVRVRVRVRPSLCFAERIGGKAVTIWGELGAVALTLQRASISLPLTILTDCLGLVFLLQRWSKQDFCKAAKDEEHWDILSDILKNIRRRVAATTVVWIKGHCWDPGNTMADAYADEGRLKEEEHFGRTS